MCQSGPYMYNKRTKRKTRSSAPEMKDCWGLSSRRAGTTDLYRHTERFSEAPHTRDGTLELSKLFQVCSPGRNDS
ncbi:hypothetical protein VZT92_024821 [Zoarces viviparus]|uniref:Uncharacterized protein n=1 Tax=Zoarces viviparus TaxID=48416 RepID=A0AAW1E397_ZOAVI